MSARYASLSESLSIEFNDVKMSYLSVRTAPTTFRSFALSLVPLK
jgi:hypothetical protein